ncbi:MAG: hypothetical protein VX777_08205 [Chlamydiota bacterium]|nr:hypothetical protein [Chlamydiota bacterium]
MKEKSPEDKHFEPPQNKDLHSMLHPYIFVLKEGDDIQSDLLDYSLLMLNVRPPEIIHSPGSEKVLNLLSPALPLSSTTDNIEQHSSI